MAKEINGADLKSLIESYLESNDIRSSNDMAEVNMPERSIQSNLIDIKEQLNNTEIILGYIYRFLVADKCETTLANPPDKEINDMLTHVSEMSSQAERIYKQTNAIAGVLGC